LINTNLPKSVYIHIPFCKSKCSYCGFFSKPANQYDVKRVLNAEIAELKKSSFSKPVSTLYIGGGSPASVGCEILCSFLSKVVELTGAAGEFTVEINPADADEKLLKELFELGVNRVSIGVQSFCDNELAFLGRGYSAKQAEKIIGAAEIIGFKNIGIDLIFAVPGSNLKNWRQTIKKAIRSSVQHISAYSLTYEKNTPLEKTKLSGKIKTVDEDTDRKMYETVIKTLTNAGFEHYEISNFAKPGFKCRHNLTYWKNEHYLGVGPAAASFSGDYRIENIIDIDKYVECIESDKEPAADFGELSRGEKIKITPSEKASQTAVLNLRLLEGIDLAGYKEKTGFDIFELFSSSIEKNLELKFLQLKDDRLSLTANALPIADSVLCDFAQPD
jgi:oxygen-independent coproporphyrinogen-3 oxidase